MKNLSTISTILLTIVTGGLSHAESKSSGHSTLGEISAIVFGQVYGSGPTKNAAFADAYRKIPDGNRALKVSYTSGGQWNCRIEWGK